MQPSHRPTAHIVELIKQIYFSAVVILFINEFFPSTHIFAMLFYIWMYPKKVDKCVRIRDKKK